MIHYLTHNLSRFGKGVPIGPAAWPHHDLLYVHEGTIELQMQHRTVVRAGKDSAILIHPHTHFQGHCASAVRLSAQQFRLDKTAALPPPFDGLGMRPGFEMYPSRIARQVKDDVLRALDLARREQTPLVLQMRTSVLTLIIGTLRHDPPALLLGLPHTHAMEPLIRWAQGQLQGGVSVELMADRMNLSTSHFRAVFLREVGISAGQYLLQLRLSEARRLLRQTDLPIKEIARQVGYASVISFSRSFRLHSRRTPATYRRQSAKDG